VGIADELKARINKLILPLKDEDELLVILKQKLTKKELKRLKAGLDDADGDLQMKLNKKLNQEKLKQLLYMVD